jgi:hypothetical protein
MTTVQTAIKAAREASDQLDLLHVEKAKLEREHNEKLKLLNERISIERARLSTLLAIADK